MGAVAVANGEPQAAFPYFARAQQLGAPVATFGVDRGLAYDLLGQQAQAQADYRASLGGPDSDEARRRLAMSLAISGNKAAALEALAQARSDPATGRCRAFVLALTGDSNGAMAAIDRAMPGSWAAVSPFLQRLPTLTAGQKAAAVNLGIFPDSGAPAYATASAPASRLGGIDDFLRAPASPPSSVVAAPVPPQQPTWQPSAPVKVASATPAQVRRAPVAANKVWLQLASGRNPDALPGEVQ
jgi:hypothetical protein